MELIEISKKIEEKIEALKIGRQELGKRAENKANCIANYERCLSIIILQIRNGREVELEGEKILNPQAVLIEKIARGICWKEKLESEKAEAEYKNAIVGMQSLQAELNGYQSIYRYLDKT